jgi:prepilin-type N-terminal cleavage/methylation domain-containing protein
MKKSGFTLIELMIVVAIIAIIAAIAIPNLLRSRLQSNESAAISNLRAVVGAEVAYHGANYQYTGAFDDLTTATPPFLTGNWGVAKQGYTFALAGGGTNFTCTAAPEEVGVTGNKGFFTDASGVVRWNAGGAATAADNPIGEL